MTTMATRLARMATATVTTSKIIPQAIEITGTALPEGTSVTVLTTSMPEGGTAMLAFTDLESLQSRTSKTPYVVMQARDVLEMVIDQDYDALVLNPAGPWATLPREDFTQAEIHSSGNSGS